MPGGRDPGHVHPELGNQQLRGGLADPGELLQPLDHPSEADDQRLDLGVQLGQVGVQGVHPAQQLARAGSRAGR